MTQATAMLKQADRSIKAGDWDQALRQLEALKEAEPGQPEVYRKLAQVQAVRGRYRGVMDTFLQLVEVLLGADSLESAEEVLTRILGLCPDSGPARERRIEIEQRRGNTERAVALARDLARLLLEQGHGERSIRLLQDALGQQPDNLDIALELAETLVAHGQIQEGAAAYRRVATAWQQAGELGRATEAYQRLQVIHPEDTEVLLTLGRLYTVLGRTEEAERELRSILRQNISHEQALLQLGWVCQLTGRFRSGILAFSKVLQSDPEQLMARRKLAEMYLSQGLMSEALDHFLRAAQGYLSQGARDEAVECFQLALACEPNNPAACQALSGLGATVGPRDLQPRPPFAEQALPVPEASSAEPLKPEAGPFPTPPGADPLPLAGPPESADSGVTRPSATPRPIRRGLVKNGESLQRPALGAPHGPVRKGLTGKSAGAPRPATHKPRLPHPFTSPRPEAVSAQPEAVTPPQPLDPLFEPALPPVPACDLELGPDFGADLFSPEPEPVVFSCDKKLFPLKEDANVSAPFPCGAASELFPEPEQATSGETEMAGLFGFPYDFATLPCGAASELFPEPEPADSGEPGRGAELFSLEEGAEAEGQPGLFHWDSDTLFADWPGDDLTVGSAAPDSQMMEPEPHADASGEDPVAPGTGPAEATEAAGDEQEDVVETLAVLETPAVAPLPEPESLGPQTAEVVEADAVEASWDVVDAASRIVAYRRALLDHPQNLVLRSRLASFQLRFGMLEEAVEQYQQIILREPESVSPLRGIIEAQLWSERYEEACRSLLELAGILLRQGLFEEALDAVQSVLTLDPTHGQAMHELVASFEKLGQTGLASLHLRQLAESALANGRLADAVAAFDRLMRSAGEPAAPGDPLGVLREYLSRLLARQRVDEAVRTLQRLPLAGAEGAELRRAVLAGLKSSLGNQDLSARFTFGELCFELGETDTAIEQFQQCRSQPGQEQKSLLMLGRCLAAKTGYRMLALAAQQLRRALAVGGHSEQDDLEVRYHLALVLYRDGRSEEALAELKLCPPDYRDVSAWRARIEAELSGRQAAIRSRQGTSNGG